ncbi:MAG: twin-arginine translocase subunit TatB [Rhodobiaceae bacterium]|nr:twin-arginine translocase subunit TatB [Rhodobiaceae bacterium]
MFDIGWTEMLVLGIVTLLVVGPRELPGLLRSLGQYTAKARDIAAEFRGQVKDMSQELDARAEIERLSKHDFVEDVGTPDLFTSPEAEPKAAAKKPNQKKSKNPKPKDEA